MNAPPPLDIRPLAFQRLALSLPGEPGAISYLAGGAGPVLTFCHATGFNALTYRALFEALGTGVRVIAPDQRGHGQTSLPADPARLTDWLPYAHDLVRFLETVLEPGEAPVVLAGHSMGATVSLMAAELCPDLVRALVLIDPVLIPATLRRLAVTLARLTGRGRAATFIDAARRRRAVWPSREAIVEAYRTRATFASWPLAMVQDYVDGGTRLREDGQVELACAPAWEAATFGMQNHDLWRAIAAVRCPVTVLRGARNSTCPRLVAWRLALLPPHARVRTLAGTSHFLAMERVPDIALALRAVLLS